MFFGKQKQKMRCITRTTYMRQINGNSEEKNHLSGLENISNVRHPD